MKIMHYQLTFDRCKPVHLLNWPPQPPLSHRYQVLGMHLGVSKKCSEVCRWHRVPSVRQKGYFWRVIALLVTLVIRGLERGSTQDMTCIQSVRQKGYFWRVIALLLVTLVIRGLERGCTQDMTCIQTSFFPLKMKIDIANFLCILLLFDKITSSVWWFWVIVRILWEASWKSLSDLSQFVVWHSQISYRGQNLKGLILNVCRTFWMEGRKAKLL